MMKKIILSLVLLLVPIHAGLTQDQGVYVPIDHIRVPELGADWIMQFPESKTRVEYQQRSEKGQPEGIYKSAVKLVREPLPPQHTSPWLWQAQLTRDLKKKYGAVQTDTINKRIFQTKYAYTEDLIPMAGTKVFFPYEQWLYSWQCDLEQGLGHLSADWCQQRFQEIQWSDDLKIQLSKRFTEFEKFTQKLPLNENNLDRVQAELTAHLQTGEVSLNELHEYAYYLIFSSLLFPPLDAADKLIFLDHLQRLSFSLAKFPASESMRAWLEVHRRYLEDELTYEDAEKLVQKDQRPPYWLLSLWMRGVNDETSLYLARRQKLGTTLHHYILGKILLDHKQTEEAIPYLKKASSQKNILPMMELAKAYLDMGQLEKAEQVAKQTLHKATKNIEPWLLLAQIQSQDNEKNNDNEKNKENDVEKIYLQLLARADLTNGDRVKIHLQRARHTANPGMQVACYEKALELSPDNLEGLYSLGRLYMLEENDKNKGVKLFERYLQVAPRNDNRVAELVVMVRELKSELHRYDWKNTKSYSYHD